MMFHKGWPRLLPSAVAALIIFATTHTSFEAFGQSDEADPKPPSPVSYWHNWTDSDGVTHLTKCDLEKFTLKSMAPPADQLWLNDQDIGDKRLLNIVKPSGWKGDWHSDVKVLWVVTLSGRWFVEAMDETRVEFGPGDVVVVENVKTTPDGQGRVGHRSGNVGEEVVKLMAVKIEETPRVDQPCRFK